jgi:aryl-alcohol dehydrogenase-like predicted oxidoreductase
LLGLGAGAIGDEGLTEQEVGRFLNATLDRGVRLIDTAPSYGISEQRIGRHLAHRRRDFVLCTKFGYGIEGVADWTGECITRGIERALQRLRTDHIDIALLHSCDVQALQRGDVVAALERARDAGKIGVMGYSGENDALRFALASGRFGALETSLNLCDQHDIDSLVPHARAAGIGVIAKRPLANTPWRYTQRPLGAYVDVYWQRFTQMALDAQGQDWQEIALRFAAWHCGAHACIVGTANTAHMQRNIDIVALGPLPAHGVSTLREAFARHGADWHGEV